MPNENDSTNCGLAAKDWLPIFRGAGVELERLEAAKTAHSKATITGNFLARYADREVPIEIDGRTGRATLRARPGRSNRKLYFFEVEWDEPQLPPDDPPRRQPVSGNGRPRTEQPNQPLPRRASDCTAMQANCTPPGSPSGTGGNAESW